MNLKKHIHWLFYGLFVLGCARQTSPTGGPKDTIPPILNQSNPKNGQTNFNSQQIELSFDETIILNNPKDQIIITPDIRKEYDIDAKKNRVVIKLTSELQDTTTYAFNFREAIQDITEKNSPPSAKARVQHRRLHRLPIILRHCFQPTHIQRSKRHNSCNISAGYLQHLQTSASIL